MGVNPLTFVLITLTKLWTTNEEILAGPVPVPVDSPTDESCRNSLAGLAIPKTPTDGQPPNLDSIFSKVFNSYNKKDSGDILPTGLPPNNIQKPAAPSFNALDSGLKQSNGFDVLPFGTLETMNCKDIASLLLGRNLPKRTTQISVPEYAVYRINNPFKRAINVSPKLYLQQIALPPVAFTSAPIMEGSVYNPNALFISPVNQFLPPFNFMNKADNNDIGARSLMNPSTTDLTKLPVTETNNGIDDGIAGRMLMNPNIIELAKSSIPAKRNSDIVDDIEGRMLTNPNIIELAKPSVPAKRNSDVVDDIEGRMLTNPNILELAKPSVPAKRNSDIVDDIEGRMLTNPNIIELAKPPVPTKRNSDIVDDIEGRMLTNPNILELAKPSVPAKRNSDIVDDIEGRMLTNPNIFELSKIPVVNIGQKRSLGDNDLSETLNKDRKQIPAGLDPLGVSPSLDTAIEKGVDDIAQRMSLFPNVFDFTKPQDIISRGRTAHFLPNEASKQLLNSNNDNSDQKVSELPYKSTDSELDTSLPTSSYKDSPATNTIPVAITDGERLPSSTSLSNLEGRIDVTSSTNPKTEAEGTNLENKTDSTSNISPVSNTAGRMDSSEPDVEGRMDNIPVENPSPIVEERTDIPEVNIEGRIDTLLDSSSKPEGEPSSSRKARMNTADPTDTLRSNERPMSNMEELPAIQGRMDDTDTQIDDSNSSVLSSEVRMDDLTQNGNAQIDPTSNSNPVADIEGRMYDLSQQESTIEGKIDSTSSEIQPLKARTKDSVSINDSNSGLNFSPTVPVDIKTDGTVPDNIRAIEGKVDSSLPNEEMKTYPPLSIDGRMDMSKSLVEGKTDSTSNNNSAAIPEARMDIAADIEGRTDNSPSAAETQELKSLNEKGEVPELRSDFSERTDESTMPTSTVGSSR